MDRGEWITRWRPLRGKVLENMGFEKQYDDLDPIRMPWDTWNRNCREQGGRRGLGSGWIVMLGGLPGEGKTTALLNIVANAVRDGRHVGLVNVEMSLEGLTTRYLSILSGVPMAMLERGPEFDPTAWARAAQIADDMEGSLLASPPHPVSTDDLPYVYDSLGELGANLVVVDYAQMIQSYASRESIFQQTKDVSHSLTYLTLEHKVTTIVGSQLVDRHKNYSDPKTPGKHDAVGGMVWTHDMGQMVFIDHSTRKDFYSQNTRHIDLVCKKNRYGPEQWRVHLEWTFDNHRMRER